MDNIELAAALRELAEDHELLWEVARREIENVLIDLRDSRISLVGRANGLVVREVDTTESSVIRLGPEMAVGIGLKAIADHLEKK